MYTVVIVTFSKRFEQWLKPLIIEVKRQRPDVEIIVGINGDKSGMDEEYRESILSFLSKYPKIYPTVYPTFRSLAKIWNLAIQFSSNDKVLILNDDITLEDGFFDAYEDCVKTRSSFTINCSFSAFSVSRDELLDINWFDERLLGVGLEDSDFINRYNRHYTQEEFLNVNIESCKNVDDERFFKVHNEKLSKQIKSEHNNNSERLLGQEIDPRHGRYTKFNYGVDLSNPSVQYPYEKFYLDNKHKL